MRFRLRFAPAALLAVALFAVYAAGACPTIYVGDSGELVTAVHVLGIPHPTGYPLYVLLGKLWALLIPFGSVAHRLSLFSAACAALACALVYRAARGLDLPTPAAVLSALVLGFAPSFWGEANIQRVYALNALFVALATNTALAWHARREPRWFVATLFVCGLGATNHTFMAVYAGAFLVAAGLAWRRGAMRWSVLRTLVTSLAAFAVGLLPYAYLPLRSRADPPLDWGDPQTFDRFLAVITRRGFWERAWIEQPADLWPIARDYLTSFGAELTWAGAALAAVGLFAGRRDTWPRLLCAVVMIANFALMAAHGSRSDLFIWHRYYVPSYVMAALLAGLGYRTLLSILPPVLRLAPLALPVLLLISGWRAADRSNYRVADAFSRAVLQSLPPGASLIATDDNVLFVLMYLTMVERLRPDVQLILQGGGAAELPPLRFNPDSDPVFFTHHPNWQRTDLDIVPVGLVFRAQRAGQPASEPVVPFRELPGEMEEAVPKDYLTQNLIGQLHYMLGFTFEQRDWRRARAEFERAAAAAPDNDVLLYNLGLIYQRNGLLDDALGAFTRARAINPRHIAGSGRVYASDRIAELVPERERIAVLERSLVGDPSLRGLAVGSPPYHARLAELLAARGEPRAALGHRLQAIEASDELTDENR